MKKDWIECSSCLAHFSVVSNEEELPVYCPYCSAEIEYDDSEYEDDFDDFD